MADTGIPLKATPTNTVDRSRVHAEVAPEPLIFLQTDTGEVILVPKHDSLELLSHHVSLSDRVAEMQSANRAVFYSTQLRMELATQEAQGHLADPQVKADVEQACEWAVEWLKDAKEKLDKSYEDLDKVGGGGEKLVELISLVEKKQEKQAEEQEQARQKKGFRTGSDKKPTTATETKSLEFSNDGATIKAKLASFKSANQMKEFLKYPKKPANKVWYVKKSKIKPAWPKFKDEDGTKWEDVLTKTAEGKRKIDSDKLQKYGRAQLRKASVKSSDLVQAFGGKKLEIECGGTLLEWAEKWNQDHTWSEDNKWTVGGHQVADISLSAEAALMRYSAGGGLNATFDPFKTGVSVKAEGHAQVSLAEGRAQAALYCPAEDGLLLYFQLAGQAYDMGAVRFQLALTLSGVVGASISGELGMSVESKVVEGEAIEEESELGDHRTPTQRRREAAQSGNLRKTSMQKKREAHLQVKGKPAIHRTGKSAPVNADEKVRTNDAGVELKVFAGIKADAQLRGAIEWRDPEDKQKVFVELASVAPMVGGMLGLAGELKLKIEYAKGRFRFCCHASLCFGLGAEGTVTLAVNAVQLAKFTGYFYYTLLNVNFHLVEIYAPSAFMAMRDLCFLAISTGRDVGSFLADTERLIAQATAGIVERFDAAEKRLDLARKVNANPDTLRYSPPETKGMLLFQLSRHSYADYIANPGLGIHYLPEQRRAALQILKWAQTQREIDNIIQHIAPHGEKGVLADNLAKLHAFFKTEAPRDIDMPLISSPYDEDFNKIYLKAPLDKIVLEGNFRVWYSQFRGYLREEPARGYPIAQADTPAYDLLKNQNDHTLFASTGNRAYYSNMG